MDNFSPASGMCGKKMFDRLGAMMKLAEVQGPTASSCRREKRMYFCPMCNAFHLTSQEPRAKAGVSEQTAG
jgi:hypothetical protein